MRSVARPTLLVLVALAASGSAFAQTGAPASKTGFSITPYIGVLIPTKDLLNYNSQTTKLPIGFVIGGRLGIGLGKRVGIEGDVGYSPGSLEISSTGSAFNQDVKTLTGGGKLTFYLIPRTSPFWIGVSGGVGAVRHSFAPGGAAVTAGLKSGTNVGGIVGASAGIRLGRILAINFGVEDYLYNASFDATGGKTAAEKQHDVRFTGGVRIPFLGF
jgi:hypothetical protein